MFNSHKSRSMIAVVAALASLAMTATADAKTRRYSAHIVSTPLATSDGYPGVGGSAYLSGMVSSSRFGDGALVDHVTIIGRPFDQNELTFVGTETVMYGRAAQRSTYEGYSIAHEDGSTEVVVNGRFDGGTKRFRDATGRYKFEGTIPAGSNVLTGDSKGRISF